MVGFDFYILFDRKGDIVNATVASAPVVFQVTSEPPYTITLTISDPGALNGLRTVCNGDVLQIRAPSKGKNILCITIVIINLQCGITSLITGKTN